MSAGGMKLSTLEFVRLLPSFMHEDLAILGLSAGIDAIVPSLSASVDVLTTWNHIDELSVEELDELAWELNILWYDKSANIDTKRELVKNSDIVYQKLGTKWAVENVIETYFGDGYIREWFEYNGTPGYFRVFSNNPQITDDKLTEFLNILNKIKRHSSKLEGIYITLTGEMYLSAGVAVREVAYEAYAIGAKAPT